MLADLDLLLMRCSAPPTISCPEGEERQARLTDAEVVTLCVAQSIMGVRSDERFVRTAAKRLRHLFPGLTRRSASTSVATGWRT